MKEVTGIVERPDFHDQDEEVWTQAWGDLLDPSRIEESIAISDFKRKKLGDTELDRLRKLCKSDLFFLTSILGYDLLSEDLHGHMCMWLERTRGERYRLILLPRGHYKSTIITICESIQIALPNVAGLSEFPYTLGNNVKLLLAHETRESASRFLFEIAAAFTDNPLLMALFPESVPTPRKQRMNKWELELPRDIHPRPKEPTFDTMGSGGAAQGRHYHHIKLDDIIGEAARDSETVMNTAVMWFDNINSLLTRPKLDGWDLIGTHWAYNDIYQHAIKMYGIDRKSSILNNYDKIDIDKMDDGVMHVYGRGVVEDNEIIFPEELDWEYINRLRKNMLVFATQYANNPRAAGLTDLDPAWLKLYNVSGEELIWWEKEGHKNEGANKVSWWDLNRMILVDPTVGESEAADELGILVVGLDAYMRIFILKTIKRIITPPDFVDLIFKLESTWYPRFVAIEEVAFSALFRHWIEREAEHLGTRINIVKYKPGSRKSKVARVRGLANYGSAGQIYIQEGMHDFRDEWEKYPMDPGNMHLLDALAQGQEVWSPGSDRDYAEEEEKALERSLGMRSRTTGY